MEPEQYILEGWDDICATANASLSSDCPLLDDEVLVEMHKYVACLNQSNNKLETALRQIHKFAENWQGSLADNVTRVAEIAFESK